MSAAVGLDMGSTATKAVLVESGCKVRSVVMSSMPDMLAAAHRAIAELDAVGLPVLTTGYGRGLFDGRIGQVSEITALAAGLGAVLPQARTVVDIGGQDSKVVRVMDGKVLDFAMNDRCAAGTGRFLEVMSRVLGIPFERFDELAGADVEPLQITSMCTVFAESEVIGLLSRKASPERILKGVIAAVTERVSALARQVGVEAPVAGTGGTVRSRAVVGGLSAAVGSGVIVPDEPQTVTALGAALLCERRL